MRRDEAQNRLRGGVVVFGYIDDFGDVVLAGDVDQLGGIACFAQGRVEGSGLLRSRRVVVFAIRNQERRRAGANVFDRRRVLGVVLEAWNRADVIYAAQGQHAFEIRPELLVQAHERRQMTARGVAGQVDALGIAAVLRDISDYPFERRGRVVDLRRMRIRGHQTIARHDDAKTFLGEPVCQRWVLRPVARAPGTAVDENQYREILLVLGNVNVQLVFRGVFRFSVGVLDVLVNFDRGV